MAPAERTRAVPKRSATAPANGWPTPHNRFCTAKARANTSRPQLFAADMGVRNRPKVERGPKVSMAHMQPQTTMTSGVRQDVRGAARGTVVMVGRFQFGALLAHLIAARCAATANLGAKQPSRTCMGACPPPSGKMLRGALYSFCSE